jgi:tetratricopeptide (TPR) repeat protein
MKEVETNVIRVDFVSGLRVSGGPTKNSASRASSEAQRCYIEGCRLDESPATWDRAASLYERAIDLDNNHVNAIVNLANVHFRRDNKRLAERLYLQALDVDSDIPEANYNLGFLEYERGNMDAAVGRFEATIASDPDFADAHYNLAMALTESGESLKSARHWRRYIKLDPHGAWADDARRRLRLSIQDGSHD